ncbi:glutathione ABC transporter substrate-binding protein [Cetobacterium sp. SF1]|uniref:glutathione ABC transporter substrate-binding protein n=1 Tax=unclassified Cetobacterium TaxID=2630983 RepID=UPI003CFB13C4
MKKIFTLITIFILGISSVTFGKTKDITVAVNANFISLDPHNLSDTLSGTAVSTMYEGLLSYNKDMTLKPVLAESYDISKDGLTYTFKLKKGIKFQDGTPLNAEAVKFNFDRVMDEKNNLRRRRNFVAVDKVEAVGENEVKIILKEPFAPMLNRIASLKIISPSALKKYGAQGIITNPVGTGPYSYVEWVQGDKLIVQRNDNYWGEKPSVDKVIFKPVMENGARIAMLQTGEADFIYPMPTEQVKRVQGNKDIEVVKGFSTITRYVTLNTNKDIFSNKKVRQAINYAINKKAYGGVVRSGYLVPLTSPVSSALEYHVDLKPYDYNIKKAKELMKEAGYENGFKATIWGSNNTEDMKGMQFIHQQLGQIGIDVEVMPMEEGTLSNSIYSVQKPEDATINMWYVNWSSFDIDGAMKNLFHSKFAPPVSANTAYYNNPKVDKLLEEGAKEVDTEKRAQMYKELQEIVWDDAPWIFLGSDELLSAKRTTTKNVYVMPDGSINFTQADTTK